MIELNKYEQQIILASKRWGSWAKSEDRFKAVKVVVGRYYALATEDVEIFSMYHCLLELYLKLKQNTLWSLLTFMENLFQEKWTGKYKREIDMEHIVRNLISELSSMTNDVYGKLEPDYEMLNYGFSQEEDNNKVEECL